MDLMETMTVLKTGEDHKIKFHYRKDENFLDHVELSLTEDEHFALVNNYAEAKSNIFTYVRPKSVEPTRLDNGSAKMVADAVSRIMEEKNTIVRNQRYEHAAYLRDVEKTLYRELEDVVKRCEKSIDDLQLKYAK